MTVDAEQAKHAAQWLAEHKKKNNLNWRDYAVLYRYNAYQFAVAVDDLEQRIGLVIRGEDLLGSTGRQIRLAKLLGRTSPPRFLHHPLLRNPDGSKLSKSAGDTGVRELRAAGRSAPEVIGLAARAAGLQAKPAPISASEVATLVRG